MAVHTVTVVTEDGVKEWVNNDEGLYLWWKSTRKLSNWHPKFFFGGKMKPFIVEHGRMPMVLAETAKEAGEYYFQGWWDTAATPVHFVEEDLEKGTATFKYNGNAAFYDPQNPDVPLPVEWVFVNVRRSDSRFFICDLNESGA